MFIEAKDDGGGGDNWTTGAIGRAKLQSYHHHQQTNIQFFTGRMPLLLPNQQCQSTEGKNIVFHGLAYPKLTWGLPTLPLTTNSSWLPRGRVAMPLISRMMPVPQVFSCTYDYILLPNIKLAYQSIIHILFVLIKRSKFTCKCKYKYGRLPLKL